MTDQLITVFTPDFAAALFGRLAEAAREEVHPPGSLAAEGLAGVPVRGWGRVLPPAGGPGGGELAEGQVGTFGTCDALTSIGRLLEIGGTYLKASPAVPERLDDVRVQAEQFLLEAFRRLTATIQGSSPGPVSTARYASLLTTVHLSGELLEDDIIATVELLRGVAKSAAPSQPDTTGWPWFLDGGWGSRPATCGSTALLLDSLIAIKVRQPVMRRPLQAELERLIDSSARYLCARLQDSDEQDVAETILCLSAINSYLASNAQTHTWWFRTAGVIRARYIAELERVATALMSPRALLALPFTTMPLPRAQDTYRERRMKDLGYDAFLPGPIISAFLEAGNHSQRHIAHLALHSILRDLRERLAGARPISTHWLRSVLQAVPMKLRTASHMDSASVEHRRYVTLPSNQANFFVLADTQFGGDSTALPAWSEEIPETMLNEVQAESFDQLVSRAARELGGDLPRSIKWSGCLHLGDVVRNANFREHGSDAVEALTRGAEVLGLPTQNIVIAPGNQDYSRPGLIRHLEEWSSQPAVSSLDVTRDLCSAGLSSVLPDFGYAPFRDMYARLLGNHVATASGGVEIVSFIGPRVTVHVLSIWPLLRISIRGPRRREYGLHRRLAFQVRDFLKGTDIDDVTLVLSHVPVPLVTGWSSSDDDIADWAGSPDADSMHGFLEVVRKSTARADGASHGIHLVLSGHVQKRPEESFVEGTQTYTAGAFFLRTAVASGAYAARVAVEEGSVRVDTVELQTPSGPTECETAYPLIFVTRPAPPPDRFSQTILETYDAEAEDFIASTDVAGKYPALEHVRSEFESTLRDRFRSAPQLRILDVGAGAGRDSSFFLALGHRVTALEGAPKLAATLRARASRDAALDVHQIDILDAAALRSVLDGRSFHGVWMCATLLHVPDEAADSAHLRGLLGDRSLLALLTESIAPGGLIYLDNKLGRGSHFRERGNVLRRRWFRYRAFDDLAALLAGARAEVLRSGWHNSINGFDAWIWAIGARSGRAPASETSIPGG